MGQMTKMEAYQALVEANPRSVSACAMYADAWHEYCQAQANIDEHGTIVYHPRTGAPIENPYIAVRDRAGRTMRSLELRDAALWGR